MTTRPPKPQISSELKDKITKSGNMGTIRGGRPVPPPSLILPPAIATLNNSSKDEKSDNPNASKLNRPTKNNKKRDRKDALSTLRGKSAVPSPTGSLRRASAMPGTSPISSVRLNNPLGSLRGPINSMSIPDGQSVHPLRAKSGVPGSFSTNLNENINNLTLRGKSRVPTNNPTSKLPNVPTNIDRTSKLSDSSSKLPNINNPPSDDTFSSGGIDFGEEEFDEFGKNNIVIPNNNFDDDDNDVNMMINNGNFPPFDPNMQFDPNLPPFDPNMQFDPNMPLFDPNMPYDPNMPLFDSDMPPFDPNMPPFDPDMPFDPSVDYSSGSSQTSLPKFDPDMPLDPSLESVGSRGSSRLPLPPAGLSSSALGPKTRVMDFGEEEFDDIGFVPEIKNHGNRPQRPSGLEAPSSLLQAPPGLFDTPEMDHSSLFAVSPNMLNMGTGMPMTDDYGMGTSDYSNISNNGDPQNDNSTPSQPGSMVHQNDKFSSAKNALTSFRDMSLDAGKVVVKRASVVAEQAKLIENSKVRLYVKKTFEQVRTNDPTLTVVSLASCHLTRSKLKQLNQCLSNNTVARKLDLSNRGIHDAENAMSGLTKGLVENTNITCIDVSNNNCGLKAALAIEKLLKVNLNITRFDIQERVFQAYDRAALAHTLQSIQWLLNSNYAYQAFKYGKSTDLVLSGRNYKQLVGRLLEGAERVQYFDISYNDLETFPIMIEEMSQVQQFIANHNQLTEIPGAAIVSFDRLMKLDLSFNNLTSLPDEICELVNVQEFQCAHNQIEELPEMFRMMQSLKRVDLSYNKITKLPQELSNLSHLEIFLIHQNLLSEIPESLFFIASLRILNLNNNKLISLPEETPNLPCLEELDLSNNLLTTIPEYFGSFVGMRRMNLSFNKLSILPDEFTRMKNMELLDLSNNILTALPESFGNLWRLIEFYAQNNKLTTLPKTLQLLKYLKVLDLCNNRLKVLDHFLCTLVSLNTLRLYKNEPLKGMPSDVLEKAERYEKSEKEEKRTLGASMTLNIVNQLPKVPISVSRMKLMIVGKEGVGKSCLYESFRLKYKKERLKGKKVFETEPTAGIRTMNMKFKDITFHTWDFSGDQKYYTTHQLFLSDRAIYLLVCNMMDGESEDARIEQWLELITRKVNEQVPIIIVGTHLDDKACKAKHRKAFWTRIKDNFGSKFPNIVAYEAISAKFNKKTDAVLERVLKVAEKRSYIPQQVMRGYQYLEERIELLNGLMKTPMTSFKRFSEEVVACGVAPDAVKEAMKFLNDAGILVYFGDVCPTLVFLDPQWIVDLVSSFNQIKQFAKKGMVNRGEFENIWDPKKYPIKYHEYILMLLERFDMLMRLKEQGRIFFPELLEEEPTPSLATLHMMWAPGYEMEEPEFRRNLQYQFIPNTLFPRVIGKIVHTLSWEIQNYWKNGSILDNSNDGSSAFIKLMPLEKTIHITVRGEKAGDDLIKILNTIQSLNTSLALTDVESFVPCTHCLLLEEDATPFMFPMSAFDVALQEKKEYVMCEGEVPVKLRALLPKSQTTGKDDNSQ